jgi:16S rRNA processing protein RimM
VDRDKLNPPERGGFYAADIEGLSVVDTDGKAMGRVRRLLSNPAHDILEVEDGFGLSFLLPMVDIFVSSVEPEAGRIVVRLPEGLREATGKGGGASHED